MVLVSGVGAISKAPQVSTTKQTTANDKPQAKFEKPLKDMAKKFNMSEEEFKKMNPQFKNWESVKAGEPVNVPLAKFETTAYALARKYNMKAEELMALNPQIKNWNSVKAGTWIMVPLRPFNDKPQAEFEKSAWNMAPKFNMTVEEFQKMNPDITDWYSVPAGTLVNVPCVELETTVHQLALRYGMKDKDLLALNPQITDPTNLKKGTWIMVPLRPFGEDKETTPKTDPTPTPKPAPKPNTIPEPKGEFHKSSAKVRLGDGTIFTVGNLQANANKVARENNRPVERPQPVIDANGNIVADVKIHQPKQNYGELKGKTIIVNAGHGGYNPSNGYFDPGTYAKDKKGKFIEEWYKNQNFTNRLIEDLTSKGAKVIFMSGHVKNIQAAKSKYKSADMFISIHCDSAEGNPAKNGQTVYYFAEGSKVLAQTIEKSLESHEWIDKDTCKTDYKKLGVLTTVSTMPSVLIEVGYQSNARDLANIDSKTYQAEFTGLVTKGVINYFKK